MNAAPPFNREFDLNKFVEFIDIVCVNETEAELITANSIRSLDDAKTAILQMVQTGWKSVIITLGENGCIFLNSADRPSSEKIVHVKASKVKTVDTCVCIFHFQISRYYS